MPRALRLLYVDDETNLLEIGKLFLEESGEFSVVTIDSALAALTLLSDEKFDAIISDYQMPGMDGIRFLIEVRAKSGPIPFILFTGKGREEVVIQALNNGADFYLQKGGDPEAQFAELSNKLHYAVSRRQAEIALQESEDRYKNISETTTDFVFSCLKPPGEVFSIDWMAGAVEGITGYTIDELRTLGCWRCLVFPDDLPVFDENVINLTRGTTRTCVLRIRTKNGCIRWLEVNTTCANTKDALSYDHIFGGCRDITDRQQAEEAIRINNERLGMAQEIGHTGNWELDLSTGTIWASEEAFILFGKPRPADGIISIEAVEELIPERERVHGALISLLENGTGYDLEYEIHPADNSSPKFLHSVARVLHGPSGKPDRVAGVIHDITPRKKAEEQAFLAREELMRTFDTLPDLICILDTGYRIERVNRAMAGKLGVTPEEMVGLTCYQCVHGLQTPPDYCPHSKLLHDHEEHTAEIYDERLGGDFLVSCTPLLGKNCELIGSVHVARDITERKKEQTELQKLTEFQDSVISNARVWLSVLDMKGTILLWNTAAEEISGYSSGEVTGKKEIWKKIYPDEDYRKQITNTINRIIREKRYLENFETTILSKQGVKKVISWNTRGLPDVTGNISGYIAIGIDITERKEEERRLNFTAEILGILNDQSTLQDSINLILAAIKRETGFDAVGIRLKSGDDFPYFVQEGFSNDFLLTENTLVARDGTGGPCRDENGKVSLECTCGLVLSGKTDPANPLFTEAGSAWVNNSLPLLQIPQEQDPRDHPRNKCIHEGYLSVALIPIRSNGEIIGLLQLNDRRKDCFSPDMIHFFEGIVASIGIALTRKRTEEALREANKKLSILSGITRHDINNRLLALNGFVNLLQKKVPDPGLSDYFARITRAGAQISAMIRFASEYEEIGVHAPAWTECRKILDTATHQVMMGPINLKNDIPPELEVFADPLIIRVFYNLIDNAVRYGGKITTIRFSAEKRDNDMILVCEDDGDGIPYDEKERIFERGVGKNTGLGLFLAREILSITGISLAETGVPGEGARFEMTVHQGMFRK